MALIRRARTSRVNAARGPTTAPRGGRVARRRSDRDPRLARCAGLGTRVRRTRPRALPARRADQRGPAPWGSGPLLREHAVPQHHPPGPGGPAPGRPRDRAPDPLDDPLERPRDRPVRQQGVIRARRGHIASFQSAATLYDVGFQHFWRAPSQEHGGDLVFVQGHSSPGIYADDVPAELLVAQERGEDADEGHRRAAAAGRAGARRLSTPRSRRPSGARSPRA